LNEILHVVDRDLFMVASKVKIDRKKCELEKNWNLNEYVK